MLETPKEYIAKVCNMFKSYGIKSVTMDDVARELGISKKTLYTHFKDKSDLVEKILNKEFTDKTEEYALAMENNSNAIEEVFGYYKLQMKYLTQQRPNFIYDLKKYYPILFDEFTKHQRDRMINSIKKNIARGIKEGLFRQDLNDDIITRLHVARIISMPTSGMFTTEELLSPVFFAEAFKYHLYAIVSDKGREIVKNNINKIIANA